jgi:hypothetical protein
MKRYVENPILVTSVLTICTDLSSAARKAYKSSVHKYLNDENDNVLGVPQQKYTLDNVDRFSMVKSRIP